MADVITKFKLETTQFDSKLRDTAKALGDIANIAQNAGKDFNNFSQKSIDAARALGNIASGATNTKDKLRDLIGAYNDAVKAYDKLSDAAKQGEFGKAMAASLQQLQQRIKETKDELYSAPGMLDKLTSKFTVSFDAVKMFNIGLQTLQGVLSVAKDAFMSSEANVDEWGRTVAASESVYQSFLNTLNTGDVSGFLSRIDEIVSAARTAYNELDRLGTMKTIQAPAMSAQQTENDRMRMMIQTGRYIAPIDGRKASMQNGQLLTPDQIRRIEQQLQNGMQKVVSLVGNEVKQTSKAIDAVYNRQAKELGLSLSEFRKGTSSMAEFDKRIAGYDQYQQWRASHTTIDLQSGRETVARGNPYEQFAKWGTFRVDGQRYNDLIRLIQQRDQQASQAYNTQSQAYRAINRAEGITVKGIMKGESGGGGGGRTPAVSKEDLQREKMFAQLRKAEAQASKIIADERAKEHRTETRGTSGFNEQNIANWTSMMKDQLSKADFGSVMYNQIVENMKDMSVITELTKEAVKRGFSPNELGLTDLFEQAFDNIDVPDKAIQSIIDKINAMFKDNPIKIDVKTGKVETKNISKDGKEVAKDWNNAASAISSVGSAMSQIEDPAAKVMGTIAQAIATIALTYAKSLEGTFTPWDWIAGAAAGLAQMTAVISTIHSSTGYAEGGMVDGRGGGMIGGSTYSMDQIPIMANAGEVILNRAQSGVLASQLEGSAGGFRNGQIVGRIEGEKIVLVANRYFRRTGQGEIVTWK